MIDTNTTEMQIRDTFVKTEKYGLDRAMDGPLAEIIGGIRYRNSGITADLFRLWDRADAHGKEAIEQTFAMLTDRRFEDFADTVYREMSEKAEEKFCSELPPLPFPGPCYGM